MNFCKDCKHFMASATGIDYSRCAVSVESDKAINPVSGEEIPAVNRYCIIERGGGYRVGGRTCGYEGMRFECKVCDEMAS